MTAETAPIDVLLVEDDLPTQAHLGDAIAGLPGLRLAARFDRVAPALDWLRRHPVQLLLTDLGLPDGSGLDLIAACAAAHPSCDILVISMFGDDTNVLSAIEAGATGYLLKDGSPPEIAQAIGALRAGGSPMSPLIARRLLSRVRGAASERRPAPALGPAPALTPRESETLELIARGYTYAEVAQLLGVSLSTVQTHIKSMYGKLAARSRTEAVFEARVWGLLGDRSRSG